MPKSTVRPPRTPKGEDPKVTIANMRRTCDMLVARIQQLVKERDQAKDELRAAFEGNYSLSDSNTALRVENRTLKAKLEACEDANKRLLGWQDCAREMIERIGK